MTPLASGSSVRLKVHIQPRASKNEIVGVHGDALKIRLTAPAVENAANEALVDFLARALEVSRSAIRIISGARSRAKVVEFVGVSQQRLQELASTRSTR